QQSLLKIKEGTIASVPPQGERKHPHQEFLQLDTSNILFIVSGPFAVLLDIIESRARRKAEIYRAPLNVSGEDEAPSFADVRTQHFIRISLIPEFIGRMTVVTVVDSLVEDSFIRVLNEPRNSLI